MKVNSAAVAVLLFLGCLPLNSKAQEKMNPSNLSTFINCAHRGASGHAPENTLLAMRMAIDMGADMAELDVQQTADDHLVVLHDDKLDRTTNGRGFLWQKSLPELQKYEAGGWFDLHYSGEPLPTLEQVINLVRGKMKLNIEVKLHGHERNVARLVVETIRRLDFSKNCIVTSFSEEVADSIKALAPDLKVGYIFVKELFHEGMLNSPVDIFSVHAEMVDAAFMKKARAAGKEVHVWTVNNKSEMHRLMDLGVDGIITNYPDRLAEVIAERRRQTSQ